MKKIKQWWHDHKPSKRRLIQWYAALLFNANLKGFFNGRIYQGPLKNICTPGMNCYSCPGASMACPLGALQNSLAASNKTVPFYMFGIIALYGLLFGRWICGFLCPFGLIQELLHKIPTPKLKKNRFTRVLSWLKYVLLVVFVFIIPLMYMLRDFPLPAFCKYICPSGTLEGGLGLLSNKLNESYLAMLGPLFTWKFLLMVSMIVATIFIFRFFCRFICPLGALYGLFNKFALVGIKLERSKCTDCGLCVSKCKMDIRHVGDHECINCGECISVCPTKAIQWKGSKWVLPANEIGDMTGADAETVAAAEAALDAKNEKIAKRNKVIKTVVGIVMTLVLVGALVYYNFIDKVPGVTKPAETTTETTAADVESEPTSGDTTSPVEPELPPLGNQVGDLCYGADLELYLTDGKTFNVEDNRGKVTIVNFWGTWCGPCKEELPEFNQIAEEYADSVTVVAIHSGFLRGDGVVKYINENFPDSKILFAQDGDGEEYYYTLEGSAVWPMTLVLDENGVIVARWDGKKVSHSDLAAAIESALAD